MGYGGKLVQQQRARELRAQSWTLHDIASELGVAKSSVSRWVRDVEFTPNPRSRGHGTQRPHPLHVRKLAEIERCDQEGIDAVGRLSDRDLLIAGVALYAGEGSKTDGTIKFANTNPDLIVLFLTWFRRFFEVDEQRLRVNLYLHQGLDVEVAITFWAARTGIPREQFIKPYRAVADPTRRLTKHLMGCPAVAYADSSKHRRVMGLVRALSSEAALPG